MLQGSIGRFTDEGGDAASLLSRTIGLAACDGWGSLVESLGEILPVSLSPPLGVGGVVTDIGGGRGDVTCLALLSRFQLASRSISSEIELSEQSKKSFIRMRVMSSFKESTIFKSHYCFSSLFLSSLCMVRSLSLKRDALGAREISTEESVENILDHNF